MFRKLNLEMTTTVYTSMAKAELRLGLPRDLVYYDFCTLTPGTGFGAYVSVVLLGTFCIADDRNLISLS